MKRQRKRKVVVIIALLLIVMGISVAFAVMSKTLNINGTGLVSPASLKIQFENLQSSTNGGAEIIAPAPTIETVNKTTIGDYSVKLTKPGDSVTFTFDVANRGDINAILTELTKKDPASLTYNGMETADEDIVKANILYTLTYTTGGATVATGTGSELAGGTEGASYADGEVVNMTLKLEYPSTAIALPAEDVSISGLGIQLVYSQNP